ncbi:MAG: hypothetical protein PHI99_09385 [Syntrophales bacterium]|nr:hypothetical protein [Syntrophales bacterium]
MRLWQSAGQKAAANLFTGGIEKQCLRLGFSGFFNLCNGYRALDFLIKINRLDELVTHAGRQPTDLPAEFADHGANQQPMTNQAVKSFRLDPSEVVMNRIVVPGQIAELLRFLFFEGS